LDNCWRTGICGESSTFKDHKHIVAIFTRIVCGASRSIEILRAVVKGHSQILFREKICFARLNAQHFYPPNQWKWLNLNKDQHFLNNICVDFSLEYEIRESYDQLSEENQSDAKEMLQKTDGHLKCESPTMNVKSFS
jgi:hypothetical protein